MLKEEGDDIVLIMQAILLHLSFFSVIEREKISNKKLARFLNEVLLSKRANRYLIKELKLKSNVMVIIYTERTT